MKAVILAAGKGVRMLPLTEDRPKVMIELNGKPFLWYVVENLKKAGVTDVAVVVGYKSEAVKDYFGRKLTYIEQKQQFGTGHAVLQAKKWVGNEEFIVMMGDNLYSEKDIGVLAKLKDRLVHLAAFKSTHPQDYGVLETQNHSLIRIHEKPSHPKSNLVNTGLYKLIPEIFEHLIDLKKSPRGELELTDAITHLAGLGKVKIYELKEYWIDMSVKEDIPKIEKRLKELKL